MYSPNTGWPHLQTTLDQTVFERGTHSSQPWCHQHHHHPHHQCYERWWASRATCCWPTYPSVDVERSAAGWRRWRRTALTGSTMTVQNKRQPPQSFRPVMVECEARKLLLWLSSKGWFCPMENRTVPLQPPACTPPDNGDGNNNRPRPPAGNHIVRKHWRFLRRQLPTPCD